MDAKEKAAWKTVLSGLLDEFEAAMLELRENQRETAEWWFEGSQDEAESGKGARMETKDRKALRERVKALEEAEKVEAVLAEIARQNTSPLQFGVFDDDAGILRADHGTDLYRCFQGPFKDVLKAYVAAKLAEAAGETGEEREQP